MKRNIFILLIVASMLIVFSTLVFASEVINVKDYTKGKFPVIFNIYLASLGDLDEYEKEFIDLLQILPEEEQKNFAKEIHSNGFSNEILEKIKDVLEKVKFGSWDKWDKEFPPNIYWDTPAYVREVCLTKSKEIVFWATNRFFCNTKKCNEKMSVILFSPANEKPDFNNNLRCDYHLAIAVFPPKENIVRVFAYKKTEGSNKLKFFEQWDIPYKHHHQVIIQNSQFENVFQAWLEEQLSAKIYFVPYLVIFEQKGFTILLDADLENKEVINVFEELLKSF